MIHGFPFPQCFAFVDLNSGKFGLSPVGFNSGHLKWGKTPTRGREGRKYKYCYIPHGTKMNYTQIYFISEGSLARLSWSFIVKT
jgi:hypothetical protein